MSHSTNATKSKQQKHPKVFLNQYLHSDREPRDFASSDTPAELEAELLENSFVMKQRFRHVAQRLRNRY